MRNRFTRPATAAAVAAVSAGTAFGQQLAFSGADGAGALATGGRGGVVYHVTRLDGEINGNRTVSGTLAYGLSDANFKNADGTVIPRTVVFDVGGTIFLGQKGASLGWDTQSPLSAGSNITIAGQTAPGGINIVGAGLKVNGNNAVIRHLTIAPGYGSRRMNSLGSGYYDQYVFDGMNIHAANVIVDHVSTPFATDEGISADEFANNVTVQYSTIANGQNYPQQDAEGTGVVFKGHALGSLWQPGSNAKTSLLHNLYANEGGRTPRFGTETGKLTTAGVGAVNDFRNNVIYNWLGTGGSGASGQPFAANFVGNYYLAGPGGEVPGTATLGSDGKYTVGITTQSGGTGIFAGNDAVNSKVFQSGNVKDINKNGTAEFGVGIVNGDFTSVSLQNAFSVPLYGTTDTAQVAYSRVLAYVGANWQNRGVIDSGIVSGVRTGTGGIIALADPTHGTDWNYLISLKQSATGVAPFNRPATFDTDGDGMPDVWEAAHALDPTAASNNGDYDNNGFTNLEEYLSELGTIPAPAPLVFSNGEANARFARIGNWTTGTSAGVGVGAWLPSRFDEVQINSGAATVDSVGQHAGTVRVATATGQVAALNVSAGWIDVAQTLVVGNAGVGSVTQSGGVVKATSVVLGGTAGNGVGTYALSGGTLATPLLTRNTPTSTFTMTGGTLHADRVTFSITNTGGAIAPGGDGAVQLIAASGLADLTGVAPTAAANVGTMTVNGDLTLASGVLAIDLASLTAFDRLAIDGTLTLGGNLTVTLLDGYTAPAGTEWKIGTAGAIAGSFAAVPSAFAVRTSNGELYLTALTAVPEPSAVAVVGVFAVAARRRRR